MSANLPPAEATEILHNWAAGDEDAPAELMPLVYQELRRRAAAYLRHERPDHTLQATALVHESFLKLVDQSRADWKSRGHFCSVAAQAMRRILVQHARRRNSDKRGGKWSKIYLDETRELGGEQAPDLVALDEALQRLAEHYPRESEVVELKFFGGLERDAIAELLQVSPKTVSRDWSFAKAWLRRSLIEDGAYA